MKRYWFCDHPILKTRQTILRKKLKFQHELLTFPSCVPVALFLEKTLFTNPPVMPISCELPLRGNFSNRLSTTIEKRLFSSADEIPFIYVSEKDLNTEMTSSFYCQTILTLANTLTIYIKFN